MSKARRSPAIFAGLVGGALLVLPETAQAQPMTLTIDDLLVSPWAYLAVGVLAGAAVSGLIGAHAVRKERRNAEEELEEVRAAALEARVSADEAHKILASLGYDMSSAQQGAPAEPVRPARETVPAGEKPAVVGTSDAKPEKDTVSVAPSAMGSEPKDRPRRVMKRRQPLAGQEPAPVIRTIDAQGPSAREQGMRPRVSSRLDTVLPRLDDTGWTSAQAEPAESQSRMGGSVPASEASPAPAPEPERVRVAQAEPAASSPSSGVNHNSYAERKQRRARGVRSLLSERIGSSFFMEGLPVIQRADGTVADVGTDWWENTLSGTITHLSTNSAEDTARFGMRPVDETSEAEADEAFASRLVNKEQELRHERSVSLSRSLPNLGQAPIDTSASKASAPTSRPMPAQNAGFASRVPSVEQGPATRPAPQQASAEADMFEQALNAMDDSLPTMGIRTSDDVDTVVVPEAAAEKLTGNVLSGSKDIGTQTTQTSEEAFDPERHADLLVEEEVARNAQERRAGSRRAGLRVLDGGTADLSDARKAAYQPKHLKTRSRKRRA